MKSSWCPFGCGAAYADPSYAEADAYWYTTHIKVCPEIERESNGKE